ncbi:MAG: type III secretion system gatekeeper subunit SctW [Deltaproteobacteria bacterium]|nr:type III secretion system gatekeeper subunit SctW [Deltaproteobacteria bacterium]
MTVEVSSSGELLADAAEELTFGVDNTDELDLKERKEKVVHDGSLIKQVKMYQELMSQIKKAEQQDLMALLASKMSAARDTTTLLEMVKKFFPDPTDAYVALSEIVENLAEGESIKKIVEKSLDELLEAEGPQVRAGLAGALVGQHFSDLGGVTDLRDDYRSILFDFSDPIDMLCFVNGEFGEDAFDRGIDFLFKALSHDLAASEPSLSRESLQAVSSQLGHARILNGAYALGQNLVKRWNTVHGQTNSPLVAMDFLKFVAKAKKEIFVTSEIADPLVTLASPPDIEKEVLFRQDLYNTSRNCLPQAFGDLDVRNRYLDSLREGLDKAIAQEDEFLASLENNQ